VAEHAAASDVMGYVLGSVPGILGVVGAVLLFLVAPTLADMVSRVGWPLGRLFAGKYFVDELYEWIFVKPTQAIARVTSRTLNQTMIEGSGSALGSVSRAVGELTCRMTTGQVATYVLIMFAATAFLFSVFVQVR
jgi:NADH-quinone oxidoreductase subunit L